MYKSVFIIYIVCLAIHALTPAAPNDVIGCSHSCPDCSSIDSVTNATAQLGIEQTIEKVVTRAIDAAVAKLERTLKQQTVAIGDIKADVSQIVRFAVDDAIRPLEENLQEQALAIKSVAKLSMRCGDDSGYTYYPTVDTCYKMHTEAAWWPVANSTCLMEGGRLAIINSDEEAQLLSLSLRSRGWWCAIIGNYRDSQGVWKTSDGTNLTDSGYSSWHVGYPKHDESNKQNYGGVRFDGQLINLDCYNNFYICEQTPQ